MFDKRRAADSGYPPTRFLLALRGAQAEDRPAVVPEIEGDIKARECETFDHLFEVTEFGFFRTQELAARRGIEEQITHLYRGPARVRGGLQSRLHIATFSLHLPGLIGSGGTGGKRQPGYRADRGQRFTTKAQRSHPLQVIQVAYLAGGVAR